MEHQQQPLLSSTCTPLDTLDNMSQEPQQFLKLEDLDQHSVAASPSPTFDMSSENQNEIFVTSRPAKKRKSWGQTLPEPKTTLPPRKRAKTEDEKEQRRIERIKRNRAAAHNSRERKRQETETLAVQVAKLTAELNAYKQIHGPLPASVVLPEVTLRTEDGGTPVPSLTDSRDSIDDSAYDANSPDDELHDMNVHIKQEPTDSNGPTLYPSLFDSPEDKHTSLPPHSSRLDSTQHSAVMLCDLQCRSSPRVSSLHGSEQTPSTTSRDPTNQAWATLISYLLVLQVQTCYKSILLALWTLSPSRMTRLVQASITRLASSPSPSTSLSMTSSRNPPLLRAMATALAQLNAATGLASSREGAIALRRQSSDVVVDGNVVRAGLDGQAGERCVDQDMKSKGTIDEATTLVRDENQKGVRRRSHAAV